MWVRLTLSWLLYCGYCSVVSTQRLGDVRLSDGSRLSGRLEVFVDNAWGTVCSNGFTMESANTACRQLGFESASMYTSVTTNFAAVSVPIHFTELTCTSGDNHILRCDSSNDISLCSHNLNDVMLFCNDGEAFQVEGGVRLIDSNNSYSSVGRLEYYLSGSWRPVCADDFNRIPADAVCRQLGYTGSSGFSTNAESFGVEFATASQSRCNIPTSCLTNCYGFSTTNDCSQRESISVSCEIFPSVFDQLSAGSIPCNSDSDDGNGTGLGVGLGIGLGIPLLIIVIAFSIHFKAFKKMKDACGGSDSSSSTRPSYPQQPRYTRNTDRVEIPTDDSTIRPSDFDSNKPPGYDEALTYKTPETGDEEGYPEPSMVDDSLPPKYSAV